MALDFLKHHDSKIENAWNAKPAKDPMPARHSKIEEGINKALAALKAGTGSLKSWYQTKDGVDGARVQLRHGSKPLTINGRDHWYSADAPKFYTEALAALKAGHLNDAINALFTGEKQPSLNPAKGASRKGQPLSAEAKHQRNVKRYGEARANELRGKGDQQALLSPPQEPAPKRIAGK